MVVDLYPKMNSRKFRLKTKSLSTELSISYEPLETKREVADLEVTTLFTLLKILFL